MNQISLWSSHSWGYCFPKHQKQSISQSTKHFLAWIATLTTFETSKMFHHFLYYYFYIKVPPLKFMAKQNCIIPKEEQHIHNQALFTNCPSKTPQNYLLTFMSKWKSLSSVVLPNALITLQFIQQTPKFHNLHCPNNNAKHTPKYLQHRKQEYITQCQALLQLTTKNHHNNVIVLNLKKTKETKIQSSPFTISFLPSPPTTKSFSAFWLSKIDVLFHPIKVSSTLVINHI